MAARNSISDDWEDIGDDSLSVLSLPTSEDYEPSPSFQGSQPGSPVCLPAQPARVRTVSVPTGESVSDTTTLTCNEDAPTRSKGKDRALEITSHQDDSHLSYSHPNAETAEVASSEPLEDPFRDPPLSEYHDFEAEGSVLEPIDELSNSQDVNPTFLLKVLESLDWAIDETSRSARELSNKSENIAATALMLCDLVSAQVAELTPILAAYARVWSGTSREVPLDPGLPNWLAAVRVRVLELRLWLVQKARRDAKADELWSSNHSIENICHDLQDWAEQMKHFLPVIQGDFNEFVSQKTLPACARRAVDINDDTPIGSAPIPIPVPQPNISSFRPRHPPVHGSTERDDIWPLWRELSRLKDEIQRTIVSLSECSPSLKMSAKALASDIIQQYGMLFNTVSLILSTHHHDPDWHHDGQIGNQQHQPKPQIPSSKVLVLSYEDFAQLNVDCIRDFAAQLEQILDAMVGSADVNNNNRSDMPSGSGYTTWSLPPPMQHRHREHMLVKEGHLDQLETLAQVLIATLSPGGP